MMGIDRHTAHTYQFGQNDFALLISAIEECNRNAKVNLDKFRNVFFSYIAEYFNPFPIIQLHQTQPKCHTIDNDFKK